MVQAVVTVFGGAQLRTLAVALWLLLDELS